MRRNWWATLLVVPALGVVDCGGNAVDRSGSGNPTGDANGGVAGSAGSAGSVGRGGNAGSAGNAGRGGNAGSVGNAGSAGQGGSGGSGGSGGTTSYGACTLTSQCVVRARDCCGSCGAATRKNVIAINRGDVGSYTLAVCRDTGCPACYMSQDPTLQARCANGACEVVDLQALSLTACSSDADCRVRTTGCCECGGDVSPEALIAIRVDSGAEYERLICDPGTACDLCVPPYPPQAAPRCFEGRCTVSGVSGTTPIPP